MAKASEGRVALVYRGDATRRGSTVIDNSRLAPVGAALAAEGFAAEAAIYDDAWADQVRDQLLGVRAALVWVDPISGSQDRSKLDALLQEVSTAGVWVSAHPDVVLKMGTKEVLYRTRRLGWGCDTDVYAGPSELESGLTARLSAGGSRVLKQYRGNGGIGVWKVELESAPEDGAVGPGTGVLVQRARDRDETAERMPLGEFLSHLATYFTSNAGSGRLIDQPFQPRITEGQIRCYLVSAEVVGFARQFPANHPDANVGEACGNTTLAQRRIFGLPSAKTMYGPDEPSLQALRSKLEREWLPGMQEVLNLDASSLPALWDADFLYGARDETGRDTYVLSEINVSSVSPFPEQAIPKIVQAVGRSLAAPPFSGGAQVAVS